MLTSYSLVLHWHQMRIASIWGLRDFFLTIPSSRARPACVAMPPHLLLLQSKPIYILFAEIFIFTYGLSLGVGFLTSSMRPDIFLRKRL